MGGREGAVACAQPPPGPTGGSGTVGSGTAAAAGLAARQQVGIQAGSLTGGGQAQEQLPCCRSSSLVRATANRIAFHNPHTALAGFGVCASGSHLLMRPPSTVLVQGEHLLPLILRDAPTSCTCNLPCLCGPFESAGACTRAVPQLQHQRTCRSLACRRHRELFTPIWYVFIVLERRRPSFTVAARTRRALQAYEAQFVVSGHLSCPVHLSQCSAQHRARVLAGACGHMARGAGLLALLALACAFGSRPTLGEAADRARAPGRPSSGAERRPRPHRLGCVQSHIVCHPSPPSQAVRCSTPRCQLLRPRLCFPCCHVVHLLPRAAAAPAPAAPTLSARRAS